MCDFAADLVHRLKAEHRAKVAGDAVWLDELERRRGELAAEGRRLMQRIKRSAGA